MKKQEQISMATIVCLLFSRCEQWDDTSRCVADVPKRNLLKFQNRDSFSIATLTRRKLEGEQTILLLETHTSVSHPTVSSSAALG